MKKKITALLLSTALIGGTMFALAACGGDTTTPNPGNNTIAGYYQMSYSAGAENGSMNRHFHFYEERDGFGSIVYIGARAPKYSTNAGAIYNYTVEEKSFEYAVWESRLDVSIGDSGVNKDDSKCQKGTAKYTVTFKNVVTGEVAGTVGYDGSAIYTGDMGTVSYMPTGGTMDTYNIKYKLNTSTSEIKDMADNELRMDLFKYYGDTSMKYVTIHQNGTFTDHLEGSAQSQFRGTATYADGTFTLTSNDGSVTETLVKATGAFTSGSTTLTLSTTEPTTPSGEDKTVIITLTASGAVPAELKFYDDNTCEYSLGGGQVKVNGTYTKNEMGIPATVTLEGYDAVTVTTDFTTMTLSVAMPQISGVPMDITVTGSLPTPEPEKAVLYTLTGSAYSGQITAELKLYDDGTCEYSLNDGAVKLNGTYTTNAEMMNMPATVTLEGHDAVNVTPNFSSQPYTMSVAMPALPDNQIPSVTVSMELPSA